MMIDLMKDAYLNGWRAGVKFGLIAATIISPVILWCALALIDMVKP